MRNLVLGLTLLGLSACASQAMAPAPEKVANSIREIVRVHQKELSTCYENAIEERPGAEGKLVLQWEVSDQGRAQNIQVKSAGPKIQGIVPCLKNQLSQWSFEKAEPGQVVEVTYPLIFSENGRTSE